MFSFFKPKIHEPLAVSALLAASAALHASWILNLVWARFGRLDTIEALYVFGGSVYMVVFVLAVTWLRGRDCSDLRGRSAHFFIVSVLMFVAMTMPFVYEMRVAG